MNQKELNKGWLIENAVLALVGALLVAQTLQPSYETYQLPFNLTLTVPNLASVVVASFLFMASFFLILASVIYRLGRWALREVPNLSPLPEFLAWLAFTVSWLSVVTRLPDGAWWNGPLEWGGLAMFLFLFYRIFRGMYQLFLRIRNPQQ